MIARSPLAPETFPTIPPITGVRFATAALGIRYRGRDDVMLAVLDEGTTVAGAFTRSLTASPPVLWDREALKRGTARAIVVNAGNANAFTGRRGEESVNAVVAAAADALGCAREEVFVSSTGVIGEPLPHHLICDALPGMASVAATGSWDKAAAAIMTTDTFPKASVATAEIDGKTVTIAGIVKGSGMIQPNMATMLGYVFTDANIAQPALQALHSRIVGRTYNCITVDSDTSTSDTVVLCATGAAGNGRVEDADDPRAAAFAEALERVQRDLAQQVVRDGEGATKFVSVTVIGARDDASARVHALSVANSPLVKTALAGEDANWGRVVMAVGKCGEPMDQTRMSVAFGGIVIAKDGQRVEGFDETPVTQHMKGQNVDIEIDVAAGGEGRATVWTCDLTHAYIDINGSYRS